MTTTLERPQAELRGGNGGGGLPARRAVTRWAWRLFKREWRQQLMVLALVVIAVGATFIGAAVAVNTPPPADSSFGNAQDLATFQGSNAAIASDVSRIEHRFGKVDVIENESLAIPGSIDTFDLRAQNPAGVFGAPLLSLVSGSYPRNGGQVAVTGDLASTFGLRIGSRWKVGGVSRRVVGTVENPKSLLDSFALVVPGQVKSPTGVTVLFDAGGFDVTSLGSNFESVTGVANSNGGFAPETIVLALATLGMLLIALVSIGGFTVLAQRRLRSIGMLGSLGATDKNLRQVVRANGLVVGVVGTVIGGVLGLVGWLAYRPHVESSSHHLIAMFAIPWNVVVPAMVIAVLATYLAASRPAKAMTKVPIVTALSGRPAPPRQIHRSAAPGIVVLVVSFFLLGYSGSHPSGGQLELVIGLVLLIVAIVLVAPMCLTLLARLLRRGPVAVRLAVRDLARYRARSGSALTAISLGVLIAVIICLLAAGRYGNVLDYAGPNLTSDQLMVYTPNGPYGPGGPGDSSAGNAVEAKSLTQMTSEVHQIARGLDATSVVELYSTSASLQHAASGRQWSGPIYVATPALLRAFGIKASEVDPSADVLSMRPGLSSLSLMQLVYGDYFEPMQTPPGSGGKGGDAAPSSANPFPCPKDICIENPVIEVVSSLPSGTSAPNTVITEHAVRTLGLALVPAGWFIETPSALSAVQISSARLAAGSAGLSIETKNDAPSSAQVINWATAFGIFLALAILAMSVGLIRSETASDLQTLAATGAGSSTRRALTAATSGSLALVGAVIGTLCAYIGVIGYSRSNSLDGLSSLTSVPVSNLLLILLAMPLAAVVGGWLLAGRDPVGMSHQPVD